MKPTLQKYAGTILCIVAILAMALPFFTVKAGVSFMGLSLDTTGFEAMKESFWLVLLLIGPVALIVMNYIKALAPHRGKIAILVPILCILILLIAYGAVKGKLVDMEDVGDFFGAEISCSPGIGFFLALLSYLGMIVAGAVTYHGYTLDKAGIEKLKQESAKVAELAKAKMEAAASKPAESKPEATASQPADSENEQQ